MMQTQTFAALLLMHRVVTNRSSGKMGHAIAEAARDRGAHVVLVTAAGLDDPPGVETVHVETSAEMLDAVLVACKSADALVMAAAVSDYRPAVVRPEKIKKEETEALAVEMVRTADILSSAPRGIVRVGFAAESTDLLAHARTKLASKDLDLIVANDITLPDSGFGTDTNKVTLVDADGAEDLPLMPKYDVAYRVLDRVVKLIAAKRGALR